MRRVVLDASAAITLVAVDAHGYLHAVDGALVVPGAVADEIREDPAAGALADALADDTVERVTVPDAVAAATLADARRHLGREDDAVTGDVAVLALALHEARDDVDDPVALTDDRPLRRTCSALGVPRSGSIGVVVHAVESGRLGAEEAKEVVAAMDDVGAHLGAGLLREAEQLIDEAADTG
jgi:predicted nucleic acid-binding protein